MVYKKDKPDPGPSPALDAPNIQGNFSTYETAFNANHTPLNDQFAGDHDNVIFQRQTTGTGPVENSTVLYNFLSTSKVDTQPQLFVRIPQFLPTKDDTFEGKNNPMQLTYNVVNTTGPDQYQSFLAGAFLIYFGSFSGNTGTPINQLITLSPEPTEILSAIATPNANTTSTPNRPFDRSVIIVSNKEFRIVSRGNVLDGGAVAWSFQWVAIARA